MTHRYICVAPNSSSMGGWKVWGSSTIEGEYQEEIFASRKQAVRNVPKYARMINWGKSLGRPYFTTIDAGEDK